MVENPEAENPENENESIVKKNKKPPNAYMLYYQDQSHLIRQQTGTKLPSSELSKLIG